MAQLVRIAKAKLDEQQKLLATLEAAKASAQSSMDWLDKAERAEQAAGNGSAQAVVSYKRFLEGAVGKRQALRATQDTLDGEIADMREAVAEAMSELKKLEHLIEVNRRAVSRRRKKAEAGSIDALAVARHNRAG